jgi:aldehyde dehydrogenase (NAD+)
VIVTPSVKDKLVEKVVDRTKQLKVGNGMREDIDMGPLSSSEQFDKVNDYIKIGHGEGAQLIYGGKPLKGAEFDKGYFVEPTVFTGVKSEMRIAQEEIFGPVLAFMDASDFGDALKIANGVQFGLAASIYCNDLSTCQKFVNGIEVGLVHINNPTVGGEAQLPFGGLKASGIGPHEFGLAAIDFFTDKITVFVDYSGGKREAKFI